MVNQHAGRGNLGRGLSERSLGLRNPALFKTARTERKGSPTGNRYNEGQIMANTLMMKKKPQVETWTVEDQGDKFQNKRNACIEKLKESQKSYLKMNDAKLKEMLGAVVNEENSVVRTNRKSSAVKKIENISTYGSTSRILNTNRSVGNFVHPQIPNESRKAIEHFATNKNLKILPKEIRQNPFGNLPVLNSQYLDQGIYTLIQRGFIPKDVDVKPAMDREEPLLSTRRLAPIDPSLYEKANV